MNLPNYLCLACLSDSYTNFIATDKLAMVLVPSSEGRLMYKNESERMQEGTHPF